MSSFVLDPDDDELLLAQARAKVAEVSNGLLDPEHPTVDALLQAQVFLQAELSWYLNLLPQATSLEALALLSDTARSPGTRASGTVVLQRAAARLSDIQIPAGSIFSVLGVQYYFTQAVLLPAGSLSVTAPIEATEIGQSGNAKAFGLTLASTGLPGIDTLYNPEPITGGSDLEPLDEYIERAKSSLWSNGSIISPLDFQREAEAFLGTNSRAIVVPLLNRAKNDKKAGQVHLFLFDGSGTPVSPGTASALKAALEPRAFAGCTINASPGEYRNVLLAIVARTNQASQAVAKGIWEALDRRYSYREAVPGATLTIRQLLHTAWTGDVTEIVSCTLDRSEYDIAMPNEWTIGHLDTVEITLVDPYGYSETWYFGAIQALNDPD